MGYERIQVVGSAPEAVIRDKDVSVAQVVELLAGGRSSQEIRDVYRVLDGEDISQAILYASEEAVAVCERELVPILQA
jgi:uncharacterized protein (DUF433 family)